MLWSDYCFCILHNQLTIRQALQGLSSDVEFLFHSFQFVVEFCEGFGRHSLQLLLLERSRHSLRKSVAVCASMTTTYLIVDEYGLLSIHLECQAALI